VYLINWLRNIEQKLPGWVLNGRKHPRLRRRPACEYSSIAAEVQMLESRQLLSAATAGVVAQASIPGPTADLLSHTMSANGTVTSTTSDNWSGYVATNNIVNSVTRVSGSWTVPTVARSTGNTYSYDWVGIDGWGNQTVEQIGTAENFVNGAPSYYAWYEMWSDGKQQLPQVFATVSPGDSVSAQVQYIASGAHAGQFQLSFTDLTRPSSNFTTYQSSAATQSPLAQRSSAEWIAEAPGYPGSPNPLANFGTVTFSNAQATINGVTQSIGGFASSSPTVQVDRINMFQQGVQVDATSGLTTGQTGSSFTVSYLPQTSAQTNTVLTGEYAVSTPGSGSPTLASIVQNGTQLTLNVSGTQTSGTVAANASEILAGNAVVATYANNAITFSSGTYAGQVWTKLDLPVNYTNQSGAAVQVLQSGTSITFVNKFGATTPAVWTSPTTLFLSAWNESVTTGLGTLTFQDGSIWSENLALNGTNNGSGTTTITAAPSRIYVFDYVNGGNKPVHVVQTGTNQVVFIFANQVFGVGTFISATQLTTPACPNDIATISNDFTTITWQDGTVWTQGARTAAVNVLDMTNAAGVAVHLIQNGSNHVAFVDSLGRTTLGMVVSPGKVVSDLYGPNDVATISGNTVSWQDGSLWTQTNNVPLTITFTDTNGALTHVRLTSATTLVGLDGEMAGVTATRQNGQIVWSNGAVWNNFDLSALNALFEMGTGYP